METTVEELLKEMQEEIDRFEEGLKNAYLELENKFKNKEISIIEYNRTLKLGKKMHDASMIEIKIPYTVRLYEEFNYNKTTEDIATLLDLELGFVSRNLRKYIHTVEIPSGIAFKYKIENVNELFKDVSAIDLDPVRRVELTKKKFLYSEESMIDFMKKYLYKVDEIEYIDISDIIEELKKEDEELEIEIIRALACQFINVLKKKNENREIKEKNIDKEILDLILNDKMHLFRLESMREIVKQQLLYNKFKKALTVAKYSATQEMEKEIENTLKKIKKKEYLNFKNPKDLKIGNLVHQKQMERFIESKEHIKLHLKLNDRQKPITLYAITNKEIQSIYDLEIKESEIPIPINLIHENIKNDMKKYIVKNKKKLNVDKDEDI